MPGWVNAKLLKFEGRREIGSDIWYGRLHLRQKNQNFNCRHRNWDKGKRLEKVI